MVPPSGPRRFAVLVLRLGLTSVAVFSALLGVAVGVVFGVAATLALPGAFVNDVRIPSATLAVSAAAGLMTAIGRPAGLAA